MDRFQKLLISARFWLEGMAEHDPRYSSVASALEFSLLHHDGERNGGDPEFIHQLSIFHHLRQLHRSLSDPAMVYMLIFLHDAVEDKNKRTGKCISLEDIEHAWGPDVAAKIKLMSKEILGQPNPSYSLAEIFKDQDAGPAKGGDRVNNVSTMVGVFKPERLSRYFTETLEQFIPNLKMARRLYPEQAAVYENIKMALNNQLTLIQHLIPAVPK